MCRIVCLHLPSSVARTLPAALFQTSGCLCKTQAHQPSPACLPLPGAIHTHDQDQPILERLQTVNSICTYRSQPPS
ncbi:hypothetical protein CMEL01_11290 [Colletotrichum melonis]|uniref:Uncharacterized protein n=1 Tax=Colletotrichum melonis TaxID=1209925 RepID=A0AAI9Y1I1_9PEZI|nr:hypothetical protein CMEL01_11290 [Colletotrichum melonis]